MSKLTFASICPQWDKVLTTGKINRKLNMADHARCMVGEARGFKLQRVISCRNCITLAFLFYAVTSGKIKIKIKHKEDFEQYKKDLVAHIKKDHADELPVAIPISS